MNNFLQRTLSGAFYVLVVVVCILFDQKSFLALLFLINAICLNEFFGLMLKNKNTFDKILSVLAGSLVFVVLSSNDFFSVETNWIIPAFSILFLVKLYQNKGNEFETLAQQILGIFYITLPLALFFNLSNMPHFSFHPELPMGIFILQWTSDTGAYLIGKSFGRHKLFERISPKKTWEGFLGAIALVILTAFVLTQFQFFGTYTLQNWIIIGLLISIFGTLGDLFESLLKRNLKIKDSGNILPGHGGALDRFDAFFFSVPAVYFYLSLI